MGFGEELDAAADLGEADAGAQRHGVPLRRVFKENFSYGGKIFLGSIGELCAQYRSLPPSIGALRSI